MLECSWTIYHVLSLVDSKILLCHTTAVETHTHTFNAIFLLLSEKHQSVSSICKHLITYEHLIIKVEILSEKLFSIHYFKYIILSQELSISYYACVSVCMYVRVLFRASLCSQVCVCARVSASVCVQVCVCVRVRAIVNMCVRERERVCIPILNN